MFAPRVFMSFRIAASGFENGFPSPKPLFPREYQLLKMASKDGPTSCYADKNTRDPEVS